MRLLIATTNPGKIAEFRHMLGDGRFEYADLSDQPPIEAPDETGDTFEANAELKAAYYAKHLKTLALADDSGLEVDALDGKPGVFSARWAEMHGAGKGNAANNALLLQQLREVPRDKRSGRFVCALSLADARGKVLLTVRGTMEGQVQFEPRGQNGFGYDPLFLVPPLGRTTAELTPAEKHEVSHRGQALRRLRAMIDEGKVAGL